eukprot:6874007-Pyramimonas_sp.AAC.1
MCNSVAGAGGVAGGRGEGRLRPSAQGESRRTAHGRSIVGLRGGRRRPSGTRAAAFVSVWL